MSGPAAAGQMVRKQGAGAGARGRAGGGRKLAPVDRKLGAKGSKSGCAACRWGTSFAVRVLSCVVAVARESRMRMMRIMTGRVLRIPTRATTGRC